MQYSLAQELTLNNSASVLLIQAWFIDALVESCLLPTRPETVASRAWQSPFSIQKSGNKQRVTEGSVNVGRWLLGRHFG